MRITNLVILLAVLLASACKKGSKTPSTPTIPIGEVDILVGNRSGSQFSTYGVSTDTKGNLFVCGDQAIYDSMVGWYNYYPARVQIGSDTLNVISSNSPLTGDQGSLLKSLQYANSIYSVINLSNSTNSASVGIRIIKTDLANNMLWSRDFSSITMATAAIQLSNTDLLIQGNFGTDPVGVDNALVLMRLDTSGNTVFSQTYTGQYNGSSYDLLEEPNNFTLVAYQAVGQPTFQTVYSSLIKTDFSGNVLSASPLDSFMGGSWHYFNSYHLRQNQAGGYILSTTRTDIVNPTQGGVIDQYFYLKLLDEQGATTKSVRVDTLESFMFQAADIAQDKTGNIYLLMVLNGSDWAPLILKFDPGGNFVTYQGFSLGRFPFALVELPNNDMILVADYASAFSIALFKVDPNLKTL